VLIAYNWDHGTERHRRIAKFVEAFFPRLAEFHKPPRHPKWREANLAAVLPGWKRFDVAEEWLKNNDVRLPAAERSQFNEFLAARAADTAPKAAAATPEDQERLFQEFLKWKQARERR
jgi:hypothetical protein